MKKINEIFYSLQGEGYHTGIPAIFVRFSGCNMKCSFCDTLHEDGIMMSDEEIISEVVKYPASMVVLTGGEPVYGLTKVWWMLYIMKENMSVSKLTVRVCYQAM